MIRLLSIEVVGECDAGPFHGRMGFEPGLHVITADNRFGKSLAFAGITWCLGVEHIYGARAGDNRIFPEAAREALEIDGQRDVRVRSSEARLTLLRRDGRQLRLSRSICGGDANRVRFDDGLTAGELQLGYGTSADATAGFQAHFREWLGWPESRLVRTRGGEYPLYLENIAPLFLLEQLRGWTGIQAEQVYRYGLQEVSDGAFEYLMGMEDRLAERLVRQRAAMESAALREEARLIASEFGALLESQGWVGSIPGLVADVSKVGPRWQELDLVGYVREKFNYDFRAEQDVLNRRMEALKGALANPDQQTQQSPAVNATSQRVIELKGKRHGIQGELRTLRAQLAEHEGVFASVEGRLRSAKDLQRLKLHGLGVLPESECPTCQQLVSPSQLALDDQGAEVLTGYVDGLARQKKLLGEGIKRLQAELVRAAAEDRQVAEELESAERALGLTTQALGPAREEAVKLAAEIMEVERDLERNRQVQSKLSSLQQQVRDWSTRALRLTEVEGAGRKRPKQLKAFERVFRRYVAALGVGGVDVEEAAAVHLGEHYEPMLGDHSLPAYGSASDRARLVLAYTLAMLSEALQHIGFVLLDEPIQQNPDDTHRARLVEFLGALKLPEGRQALVLTSLRPDERETLTASGVNLSERAGSFLVLGTPEPANAGEPDEQVVAEGDEDAGARSEEGGEDG